MGNEQAATGRAPGPGPTIVLAISGGIAAYQAAEVARLLVEAGARVIPLMTREAREFVGARALLELTGEAVRDESSDLRELAHLADVILLVPAPEPAGRAGDPVTALALAAQGRVLVTPRAAPPAAIAAAALARATPHDLAGLRVVVTAGPTVEDLDPVRFLGNRSTGKMGFAVAERASVRGAAVTLIAGPVTLPTPIGARRVDVRGALAMRAALWDALGADLGGADALIMTAAVADYRPAESHPQKRKRTAANLTLELVPNPDLLAEIGAARSALALAVTMGAPAPRPPALVGFAVETDVDEQIVAYARGKLEQKRVDLVVANHAGDAFGRDDNRATLVDRDGAEPLGVLSKLALADRILDRTARLCHR